MLFDCKEKNHISAFSLFTFTYYLIDKLREKREEGIVKK